MAFLALPLRSTPPFSGFYPGFIASISCVTRARVLVQLYPFTTLPSRSRERINHSDAPTRYAQCKDYRLATGLLRGGSRATTSANCATVRRLSTMLAVRGFGKNAPNEPEEISRDELREAIRFLSESGSDPESARLRQKLRRQLRKQFGRILRCEACQGRGRRICLMCGGSRKMEGFLGKEVPCYPCEGTGLGRPCRECNGMGFFDI
ncbi:hypothetical protein CCYA_CCYA03G0804 [Cyanidiococcus yangmingshanensis]|nr:hypothetical protein CCYA_CCYA03G0804 [Cyanidiococcus yangmingshanensis]